jgi:hypothetical protein
VIFVYSGSFTFLVDCYPLYAASALAANSFARSSFAAAFPLFGVQMYESTLHCPFQLLFRDAYGASGKHQTNIDCSQHWDINGQLHYWRFLPWLSPRTYSPALVVIRVSQRNIDS